MRHNDECNDEVLHSGRDNLSGNNQSAQKMKVGIVTDPCEFPSGVKTYVDNLVKAMAKIHHEIYLIHGGKGKQQPLSPGVKEIILPSFYRGGAPSACLFDVHRPFLLRKYKLDIVHYTHNYSPLTFWVSGSSNVCTMYAIAPLSHPQFHPLLSHYTSRLSAFMGHWMDMILTDSEWAKAQIMEFCKVPSEKVRVIYFGLDKEFKPEENRDEAKSELRARYGIQSPFILQVNAYRHIKNAPVLVRAFGEIRKVGIPHHLVLVGNPAEKYNEVAQLVKELGLDDEVMLLGYIPKQDLIKLYRTADIVVIPSFKESFCLPLLESLACGCPTISSNATALPEIGGDAAVFFDPYSLEELASKIYQVVTNSELRIHLSKNGLQRAKLFSWQKCAQEHLLAYQDILLAKNVKRKGLTT